MLVFFFSKHICSEGGQLIREAGGALFTLREAGGAPFSYKGGGIINDKGGVLFHEQNKN